MSADQPMACPPECEGCAKYDDCPMREQRQKVMEHSADQSAATPAATRITMGVIGFPPSLGAGAGPSVIPRSYLFRRKTLPPSSPT
jgi:hypothetical protein